MYLRHLLTFLLLVCASRIFTSEASDSDTSILSGFDLPVIGETSLINKLRQETTSLCNGKMHINSGGNKIPHHLWMTGKDNASYYLEWAHIKSEIELNPLWSIHICDDHDTDMFMAKFFPNTSLLYSYKNINNVIAGASKADIWRYAVLYVFGGVYIDTDSQLRKPLSAIIQPADEMILAFENNHYDGDWCYNSNSEFATKNIISKNPGAEKMDIFHNRILVNWCMMSAPYHMFLAAALDTFVKLSKLEYLRVSDLKVAVWEPFSKLVYCTTGPTMFTAAARSVVLGDSARNNDNNTVIRKSQGVDEGGHPNASASSAFTAVSSYRLVSKDFGHEGGRFKAIKVTKGDKNHYTQIKTTKVHLP